MEPEIDLQRRESRHGDGKSDTIASDNDGQRELVYFRDHLGERYAFPFEQCVSRGSIQYLFSEIYTLRDQSFLERITKRDFIIQTDGATILPDFWGTAIKPGMTIDIKFPEERVGNGSRDQSTHHSRSASPEIETRGPRSRFVNESEYVEAVTRDDRRPTSPAPAQQQSDYSTDSDSEQSAGLSEGEFVPVADMPDFLRQVLPPLDAEGNQLSFQVDTKHRQKLIRPKEEAGAQKNEKQARAAGKGVGDYHVETFRITKAMVEVADGKGQIKVYVLPGPETPHFEEAVTCTWYHISGGQLDFTRFRDVCLTMPHLNDRLRKLTSEMLNKVYSEKVKPFDGGMFIEPGTVLRADESDQPDPQSVIFSCVPYLGLNPLAKRSARTDNTQFPQRTLMETFYPYEPVHERDSEQSYRRFGNERSDSVIHVPNLWMMNIGSNVVVTHGHAPLSKEMTNSMTVIEEDIKQLGTQTVPENDVTKIRLTDSGGRDFIFPPSVCRSYLQMEARVREIEYVVNGTSVASRIFLKHKTRNGSFRVLTEHWKYLIAQNNVISINLIQVSESEVAQLERTSITTYTTKSREVSKLPPMPPFFEWPQPNASTAIRDCKTTDQNSYSPPQAIGYLEQIDKAMMTEVLRGRATSVIHRAFESTHYYESLPEAHYAVVRDSFAALRQQFNQRKGSLSQSSFHQVTVNTQRTEMIEKSLELFNLVHNIVTLFVSNMDEGRVIGKTWGAMAKLLENIANIEDDSPSDQDSDRHKTHGLERGQARQFGRSWLIRNTSRLNLTPIPDSKPELLEKITKCKRSKKFHPFSSMEDAIRHLQHHTNPETEPGKHWETTKTEKLPDYQRKGQERSLDPQLKDWVMTSAEFWREQTNAGVLVILTMACKLAKDISEQAEDLIDGVQNENGQMSELYTLPKELAKAFRLIVTFFMATERALYGVNDTMEQEISFKVRFGDELLPYPKRVCNTLKVFGQTAIRSLRIARSRMCYMARTNPPLDLMGHLSFGSEYICAWLIRRLSLKPLEKHQTAGDLYREYISRLQFQVNHHPSKRLLRDLNLLQEELQILNLVTVQQRDLAKNYSCVLDDLTYEKESLSRKSMYSFERALLDSCIANLDLVSEDYRDLVRRCGPLADRTKQSLEINEEDHGKAIMVFTVVTVIFLPLSFVTSYMGMNTVDIRDMNQGQGLFWSVATPLTVVTVGICLLIGYNGDGIRDMISSLYHKATGKQERNTGGGGMSVPRRKRPLQLSESSSSTLGSSNIPNEAEFANPRPVFQYDTQIYTGADERFDDDIRYTRRLHTARPEVRTQTYAEPVVFDQIPTYKTGYSSHRPRHNRRDNYAQDEYDGGHVSGRYESYPIPPPPRRGTYDVDRDSFTGYPRRNLQARIVRLEMPSRGPPLGPYETEPMDENEAELYSWEKKRSTQRSGGRRIEREYRDRVHDDWGDEDSNGESWYRRRERRRDDYRDEYRER